MSGRRVNFRESPPSSGVSSRYTNDSADYYAERGGVGSSSATASSRYSGGGGSAGVSQWTGHDSLHDRFRDVEAELEKWKTLAEGREAEVEEAKKQASEAKANLRAVVEQIEDEKKKRINKYEERIEELLDEVVELRNQLAEANAAWNEQQHRNSAPAYGTPGTSSHHHASSSHLGHAEPKSSSSSSSRHAKEGKSSSSTKSSSNTGSGTSSGSSGSHSSSRAKVGSSGSSSTNTAKVSRSGSRHEHSSSSEMDQKKRLSQRFEHRDDGMNDSNASASSAASSSSQKHHKSGSSGNGSSGSNGSNGSSTSAESGSMRPPQSRAHRGSYVEAYGPGAPNMMQTPMSPNKGAARSSQPANILPPTAAGGVPASSYYGAHSGYAPPMQPLPYGTPTSSSGLMSPRGDMGKDSLRPSVHIVSDNSVDPHQAPYYGVYRDSRGPRDRMPPR